MGWQVEVLEVFQKYTDRVPGKDIPSRPSRPRHVSLTCAGSFIERKRCALTWHYRQADPEQGLHMSQELHKDLEAGVASYWDVDIMKGKANLEVRPTFINKGEIVKRLVASYNADMSNVTGSPSAEAGGPTKAEGAGGKGNGTKGSAKVEFVLCMGDDFTDEDMFRALSGLSTPEDGTAELVPEQVFTVTVGPSTKVTLARWHLLEPEDVIDCVPCWPAPPASASALAK